MSSLAEAFPGVDFKKVGEYDLQHKRKRILTLIYRKEKGRKSMEEESRGKRISLLKCILILIVVAMIIFVVYKRIQSNKKDENINSTSNTSSIETTNTDKTDKNDASRQRNVIEDSNSEIVDEQIERLINYAYAYDFYSNAIEEFDTIKNASQKYLFAAATNALLRSEMDMSKLKYEDFNGKLVEMFGKEANNLLKKESISNYEFDYDADTGIYSVIGRGLSEDDIKKYIIDNISKQEDNYIVTIYEYIWRSVDEDGELSFTIDNASNVLICGLDEKTLLKFDIKEEKGFNGENEYTEYNLYDNNGILVDDLDAYLKEHIDSLKNKREVNIKYDKENDKYIIVSNKIVE